MGGFGYQNNPMHMVGHNNEFVQYDRGIVVGQIEPREFHHLSRIVHLHFALFNFTE